MATVILGSNTMQNCQQALVVCGTEVFRLRQRDAGGHLVADFDLCDGSGRSVATVEKNHLVRGAPGTTVRHGPMFSEVLDASGTVLGRAEEVSQDVVRVIGTFGTAGKVVTATADALGLPGGGGMRSCSFRGIGTVVEIDGSGTISFGRSASVPPRPGFRQMAATPQLKSQSKRRR